LTNSRKIEVKIQFTENITIYMAIEQQTQLNCHFQVNQPEKITQLSTTTPHFISA